MLNYKAYLYEDMPPPSKKQKKNKTKQLKSLNIYKQNKNINYDFKYDERF